MSLFQARDWWTAAVDSTEEFGHNCMVVGNVDNDATGQDKIVTGSFSGVLRVYFPRQRDYKIEDLILEQRLDYPVLGLLIGRFTPNSPVPSLAVLHPRRLVVYTVSAEGDGSYYKLNRLYSHNLGVDGLHFTACNMCAGPFGGAYGKDSICVQSMDGQLSFFEQDHYSFTRQLSNCMLPGPMCYVERTDSIVTATSELTLESYKYQMLAAASSARPTERKEPEPAHSGAGLGAGAAGGRSRAGLTASKGIKVDWTLNLGEHILELRTARYTAERTTGDVDVIALGERTLFALKNTGRLRFQKRLDYNPTCLTVYQHGAKDSGGPLDNVIIGTDTDSLKVYKDVRLIWAAVVEAPPLALAVSSFAGTKGLVVAMGDDGTVRITYMGTDPPTSGVSASDSKELNYEEMDEEHRRLLMQVKESHSEHRPEPSDRILLRAQVPNVLDVGGDEDDDLGGSSLSGKSGPSGKLTVRLFISYTGADKIDAVNVSLAVPGCILVSQSSFVLPNLAGGKTPMIVPLVFRANPAVMPGDLTVKVAAAYLTNSGEPRTAQLDINLPLCVVCNLVSPLKNNTFKFTLDTNKLPPQLPVLFDDMFSQPGLTEDAIQRITASSVNVLSFKYYNGDDATILVSKTAGRYRVQSGNLQALWMVSCELVRRLKAHFSTDNSSGKRDDEPFQIAYQEPLPLADFFACIDDHFQARQVLAEINATLNDRAHQFRLIQKRLLVRFKERNPTPLNNLDMLMHGTYNQLIDLGTEVANCQSQLRRTGNDLSCATHLLLLLMRYRFDLDDNNFEVLQAHLSPQVVDNTEQGWEECIDAAMTHLLRTCLAKSAKDSAAVPPPLTVPQDTTKLKKHITIVCDRLTKGARLYRPRKPKA